MSFDKEMTQLQVAWRRRKKIAEHKNGRQNGKRYDWILPKDQWEEALWCGIRGTGEGSLEWHLQKHCIKAHTGVHNLKSSWVLCANLYFPFGATEQGRRLIAGFLQRYVHSGITEVDDVQLEYAEEGDLHPSNLLGERGGSRGTGQTSPDIAFIVNDRKGLILVENKLVEHSFYRCSARRTVGSTDRPGNPDPDRCQNALAVASDPDSQCHQNKWERRYWQHLKPVVREDKFKNLKSCPAAIGGYQLFRQQALAEGIAQSGRYDLVVSAVALDNRNKGLRSCLTSTGLEDVSGWGELFSGKAGFSVFTHQDWVQWVHAHDTNGAYKDWLDYVSSRYGLE